VSHVDAEAGALDSVEAAVDWLRKHFDPEAARGLRVVYALELTGAAGGVIAVRVDGGQLDARAEPVEGADLRLRLAAADYFAVLAGRANADLLFMQDRIEWEGELSLALKLRRLFRGQPQEPPARSPEA
jgi:ubiquinone biosynthesis protein UbiJ